MVKSPVRNLVLVLGDQLDADGAAFDGFDAKRDRVLMSEVTEEASYVPQHAQRLVLFFSAMRHLRAELEGRGCTVLYGALDDKANTQTLTGELERRVRTTYPERIVLCQPGDHRVLSAIKASTKQLGVELEIRPDCHFIDSLDGFKQFAEGRKELIMETYYRRLRRRENVLMDGAKPVEGRTTGKSCRRMRRDASHRQSASSLMR